MDSLTQIVLGAAAGELVLGRKLGNRAMIWGGIAGTIPDLDVIVGTFVSPTTNLHVHRGLSHSLFLLFGLSFVMAWLTTKIYPEDNEIRKKTWYKFIAVSFRFVFTTMMTALLGFMLYFFIDDTFIKWPIITTCTALAVFYMYKMYREYNHEFYSFEHVHYKGWLVFFIFTLLTHPLLDCFTVYGTQIFSPFTDARISWDNISVADPAYTIALGLPIWIASFFQRKSKTRLNWVTIGVILSSAYMMSTIYHKHKVNAVLQATLEDQGIKAEKSMTNPTIFNSILWSATVKTQDSIYTGLYSVLDKEEVFELKKFPINEDLLKDIPEDDYTINTIKWFSKGYYTVQEAGQDSLQMNDLRYGTLSNRGSTEDDFIFKFNLYKDNSGQWQIDNNARRPPNENAQELFRNLFRRMLGK